MGAIRTNIVPLAREPAICQSIASSVELPLGLVVWAAASLALNVGLSRFTYGMMLPSLKHDFGFDFGTAGLLHAAHLGGYMIGTLAAPVLGQMIEMGKLTRFAHSLVAAGALLCAIAPASAAAGPYALAVGRVATGVGGGAAVVAIFALVLASVPTRSRSAVSAAIWGGVGGVVVLSACAAPHLAHAVRGEWRLVFWLTASVAICLAAYIPDRSRAAAAGTPASGEPRFAILDVLTARWCFLGAAYFCFGAAYIGFATFLGSRLLAGTATPGFLGLTWAAFGVAIMAGAMMTVFALRAARLAPYALAVSMGIGLVGAFIATGDAVLPTLSGTLLVGLSVASTPAIVTAFTRQRCSAEDYVRAFGYVSAAVGLGQLLGPAVTGMLADQIGTDAVPLVAMALYACGAGCGLLDRRFGQRK